MTFFNDAKARVLPIFAAFGLIFAFASDTVAENPSEQSTDDEGWISLFDGETLGSWKKVEEGGSGDVAVKNGVLSIGMGAMSTGIRYEPADGAEFPVTDYEIEFIARRTLGNDFFAALTFPVGDSFCTLVNGGWGGTLIGLSSIDGFDASENSTSSYYGFKNKIWYIFRLRVTSRVIRAWLDDEPIIKTFLDGRQVSTRIEMSSYEPLGFATWICEGEIKKIHYRRLTVDEIAESAAEADRASVTKKKFPVE